MSEQKHKDVWSGKYRGIAYEVVQWEGRRGPIWNYYLYVHAKQIPTEHLSRFDIPAGLPDERGRRYYPYSSEGVFARLDWHCGITYYSKMADPGLDHLVFKAGCDYDHYWDEDCDYSMPYVLQDAKATIDDLWEHAPYLMAWCHGCGKYEAPGEAGFNEEGTIACKDCLAKVEVQS